MVSGTEHKNICRQLLRCLLNAKEVPAGTLRATRALVDFLCIAQHQNHAYDSLQFLQEARAESHPNKEVFLHLDVRFGTFSAAVS